MIDITDEEFMKKLIIDSIRIINNRSFRSAKLEVAKGELTTPQLNAMFELAMEDGLSLKELSKRLNLSHSTVSGIIDRLEMRGLVIRKKDPEDGRFTEIYMSSRVNEYAKNKISQRFAPFLDVIHRANPEEKLKILEGFSILNRLLNEQNDTEEP